ncbi:MAG TPA: rod shape-determining protein MreD [Elusimicrobiota bacterium]|nr:rod shape-determining protein MreD [Elusimicrobiota bacterium]
MSPWLFGFSSFLVGWALQLVLLGIAFPASATPQWLMLSALALGGMGKTDLAQTLGLLWGLSLDVFGVSLFGSQGFLLMLTGYVAGRASRQLNAEKPATQLTLAFLGSFFFMAGLFVLEYFFRSLTAPRHFSFWTAFFEFALNLALAPLVFLFWRKWLELWSRMEKERAS